MQVKAGAVENAAGGESAWIRSASTSEAKGTASPARQVAEMGAGTPCLRSRRGLGVSSPKLLASTSPGPVGPSGEASASIADACRGHSVSEVAAKTSWPQAASVTGSAQTNAT